MFGGPNVWNVTEGPVRGVQSVVGKNSPFYQLPTVNGIFPTVIGEIA